MAGGPGNRYNVRWRRNVGICLSGHLVGDVGGQQGVAAVSVVPLLEVLGHGAHHLHQRGPGRVTHVQGDRSHGRGLHLKSSESDDDLHICNIFTIFTMSSSSLSSTRGRKETRHSGLALPTLARQRTVVRTLISTSEHKP